MEQVSLLSQKQTLKDNNLSSVSIDIVRNLDDLTSALEIRRKAFVLGKGVDEDIEFDGNDFACTHILMKVDEKPAGTLRIRCFKDFAKMERLCIKDEFRGKRLYKNLLDYTENYLKEKGYDCFIGYILSDLSEYWLHRGFRIYHQLSPIQKGSLTLLPVVYPFKPRKIKQHQSKIDLLAKEGHIRYY